MTSRIWSSILISIATVFIISAISKDILKDKNSPKKSPHNLFELDFTYTHYGLVDKELQLLANEGNKQCPVMIDQDTRLDSISVLPNKIYQNNFTLVNYYEEDLDVAEFKDLLEVALLQNMQTNSDVDFFRKKKAKLGFSYHDKAGAHLFTITYDEY